MLPSQKISGTFADKVASILRVEADAILRSAERLDAGSVEKASRLLIACSGKVVVMGIGKSGVIAQKVAQTLASTGTTAIFIHPSDALHGSLGTIVSGDVVIALSNSGETEELLALIPAIRKRNVSIISIIGNVSSSMATQSDVVIDASVDKEACPLNLAPTASTTVALAIGDALAMAVMEERGLTSEDFAANHPAGRLGKRLTIRVGDLMHASPSISQNAGWLEVIKAISKHSLGAVNVVDETEKLIGIITDGDLRRTLEKTETDALTQLNAAAMMTADPISASKEMLAFEALNLMENRSSQISVLPVVTDDLRCVGLLRLHDIVRAGL
jgi:arabinose-5-phosphate isomerase